MNAKMCYTSIGVKYKYDTGTSPILEYAWFFELKIPLFHTISTKERWKVQKSQSRKCSFRHKSSGYLEWKKQCDEVLSWQRLYGLRLFLK